LKGKICILFVEKKKTLIFLIYIKDDFMM
jgi:hypothetical protein